MTELAYDLCRKEARLLYVTHTSNSSICIHVHIVFVQVYSICCANKSIQQIMHFNVLLAKKKEVFS